MITNSGNNFESVIVDCFFAVCGASIMVLWDMGVTPNNTHPSSTETLVSNGSVLRLGWQCAPANPDGDGES